MPEAVLAIVAMRSGVPVATALCFRSADTLYGRYWGSEGEYHSLHFETCYYQGIEYCIEQGLQSFEPGTQGEHKISRGFVPTETRSAHWLSHPQFASAIDQYLARERSPYRRVHGSGRRTRALPEEPPVTSPAALRQVARRIPASRRPARFLSGSGRGRRAGRWPGRHWRGPGTGPTARRLSATASFPGTKAGNPCSGGRRIRGPSCCPATCTYLRSLRRTLTSDRYRVSVDLDFAAVIGACADLRATQAPGSRRRCARPISACTNSGMPMPSKFGAVMNWRVGCTAWRSATCSSVNRCSAGRTDASKVALVRLVRLAEEHGIALIDCQVATRHLASLGSHLMPRGDFLRQCGPWPPPPRPGWLLARTAGSHQQPREARGHQAPLHV